MADFAKLFESKKYGQIAVFRQPNEERDNPEIRFFVKPDGFGICSLAIEFAENKEDAADKAFAQLNLETSESFVSEIFSACEVLLA